MTVPARFYFKLRVIKSQYMRESECIPFYTIDAGFGHVITNTKGKVIKKVADRIPHDFRRTAVRNLERAELRDQQR